MLSLKGWETKWEMKKRKPCKSRLSRAGAPGFEPFKRHFKETQQNQVIATEGLILLSFLCLPCDCFCLPKNIYFEVVGNEMGNGIYLGYL